MLEQRHNTHVLSSFNSSSDNHSYNNENKKKKRKSIVSADIKVKTDYEQLYNKKMEKINDILNKYNIISNQSSNKEEKKVAKKNKKIIYNDEPPLKVLKNRKTVQLKNDNILSISNSLINSNSNNKIIINKDKTAKKIEEQKNNDFSYFTFHETSNLNNKKNDFLSYKKSIRDIRFNNIQKYIEEENKNQKRKKLNSKNKLLLYQPTDNSRNLIRSIKKSETCFITKESKTSYILSNIKFNVRNDLCFYTKKIIGPEEHIKLRRKIKKLKFEKLKGEVEDEKIPTFSSIDSSSSNNSLTKIKSKGKSKTKLKTKKKKTHIKPKPKASPQKKKLVLPKNNNINNRPLRSISVHSKFSNESNQIQKPNNININKGNINKKLTKRGNKERKYSILARHQDFYKKDWKDRITSSKELRNLDSNNKVPLSRNLLDINKPTDEGAQDKDKETVEKDFKKFLEEQRKKRNNQIMNFMRRQGMNSYNFFYPKEPSPLLSTFKNKYSVYPTLNINRRSSLDKDKEKPLKEKFKTSFNSAKTFLHEKKNLKRLLEENENEREKKYEIIKMHIKEKHYGNENDCPICRLKREKEEMNTLDIKSIKYNRFKVFSPIIQNGKIKIIREFEPLNKNRVNSARMDLIGVNQHPRRNFSVILDYFMQ